MARLLAAAAVVGILIPDGAAAQSARGADADIVVIATRSRPSNWREAETTHVILLSDGSEAELMRLARNLERLHFLLAGLFGEDRIVGDREKIRITLIGETAQFEAMDLRNLRWQQGPYRDLFKTGLYYDPREDGTVMASSRVDQRAVIDHSANNAQAVAGILSAQAGTAADMGARTDLSAAIGNFEAMAGIQRGPHDLQVTFGEKAVDVPAERVLYAGYAQHFLMTYFPAAYPRWYLDGFGQIFSTMAVPKAGVLEFGRAPEGLRLVLQEFGAYPLQKILSDAYLTEKPSRTAWTPAHAWMLTHFLFFSDARRPQLNKYLAARAGGADAASAAAIFGDQVQLANEVRAYFRVRKPYLEVKFDEAKIEQPVIRRLRESEAAFVKGRLELGSRLEPPPAPPADAAPDRVTQMTRAREVALKAQRLWLDRLRRDADRWSGEPDAQLLLAEAECRTNEAALCLAAAARAEAIAQQDPRVFVWKGIALAERAASAPASERTATLAAARQSIVRANSLDPEAVLPLLAYYDSFPLAGEPPTATALAGLEKVMDAVPTAPATRLKVATTLVGRDQAAEARAVILPVAAGAYETPERPAAAALLNRIDANRPGVRHAGGSTGDGARNSGTSLGSGQPPQ